MHDLIVGLVPQNFRDLVRVRAHDLPDIVRAVVDQPPSDFPAFRIEDADCASLFEIAIHFLDSGRQQTGTVRQQRLGAAFVDFQPAFDPGAESQPALAKLQPVLSRRKQRADRLAGQNGLHRAVTAAGSNDHHDAGVHRHPRRRHFGQHPAGAAHRAGAAAHRFHFRGHVGDFGQQPRLRIGLGIGGVNALHVGQDDQHVGIDNRRHIRRQRVIVADFQFVDGHGVVFIDDGNNPDV